MKTLAFVMIALLALGSAQADKASDKKKAAQAQEFYREGTTAYDLGDFKTAIEKYKAAYQAKSIPVFLYNIAQAYRLSNDIGQALFFYKSYLRNAPTASNRDEVDKRIAELEDRQVKMAAPPNNPVAPEGGEEPDERTSIPTPEEAAEASDEGEIAETPPAPTVPGDDQPSRPIYKKWWFWGAIGAVAATTAIVIVASSGTDKVAPDSDLGDFSAN